MGLPVATLTKACASAIGVGLVRVVEPSPTAPTVVAKHDPIVPPLPQHASPPVLRIAHAIVSPTETVVHVGGALFCVPLRLISLLSPSWPLLLLPQPASAPLASIAHVELPPALTACQLPSTCDGSRTLVASLVAATPKHHKL